MSHTTKLLLQTAIQASLRAGKVILDVYEFDFEVQFKNDDSPLTIADTRAHEVIKATIEKYGVPILSEEGGDHDYATRSQWQRFWLVDPLDGTKEFVKRNGEFTVNIALIDQHAPILGVIYHPVKELLYFGAKDIGAFKINICHDETVDIDKFAENSTKLPEAQERTKYTVVGSRSHLTPETEQYIEELKKQHGEIEMCTMGSSLKICLVAEGTADIYPRFAPTMEWDTAAGHAIANAAGKQVIDQTTNEPMKYNKENLINNWFVVS